MAIRLTAGLVGAALLIGSQLGAGPAFGETVSLKMQSAFPAGLPASGTIAKQFAERVTTASGGTLEVRFFDVERLVPALEIHNAVAAGDIEAGWTTPSYMVGKAPAAALFAGGPFGPSALTYMGWLYHGGGLKMWREIYAEQGLVPTPCGLMEPESGGWFHKEINTVDDLNGLKIRFSGIGAEVLRKLGASPTLVSVGEVFPSLERKVVDAAEVSMPAIDRMLKLEQVAKYYYVPGWHQPAIGNEFVVSKELWDSLSDAHRELIESTCQASMLQGGTETIRQNGQALEYFKSKGVEVRSFPPEVVDTLRQTTKEVYAEHAANDADFKRVYESMQQYRAEAENWMDRRSIDQ